MCIVALFTIGKIRKHPKWLSIDDWRKKLCSFTQWRINLIEASTTLPTNIGLLFLVWCVMRFDFSLEPCPHSLQTWGFSSECVLWCDEASLFTDASPILHAHKGFLPWVCPLVYKIWVYTEAHSIHPVKLGLRFWVCPLMCAEICVYTEVSATHTSNIGVLFLVYSLLSDEIWLFTRALPTLTANLRLLFWVCSLVCDDILLYTDPSLIIYSKIGYYS